MSIILTQQNIVSVDEVYQGESEEFEASTFAEFARALFLGLGALLLVSASTYLAFSGIVATLMALLP